MINISSSNEEASFNGQKIAGANPSRSMLGASHFPADGARNLYYSRKYPTHSEVPVMFHKHRRVLDRGYVGSVQ